ncbi:MAG TPA: hypothetical protein DIU15_08100 [Deltaproteobacteria bacterium]|nr:hypothetical protein [Deltaproteobacteria bacterium]HCP45986.1 hypothetical protein [Deltaproteobacteria bacterium]
MSLRLEGRARLYLPLACVAVLAALARGLAHPTYFVDGEALIGPTVGRELFHGHLLDLFHYQIIVYQGSLLVDALLAVVGFAVFGDHLLAWQSVSLVYIAVLAVSGSYLLDSVCGRVGAIAFPLLLATAPFLVKDGLLAGIGGHGSGVFYAVLSTALAVSAGKNPDQRGRALLAGAALAFGCWYIRTVILALPACLLAVSRGGPRTLVRFGLGLLVLPTLLLGNIIALWWVESPYAADGILALCRTVVWEVRELGSADQDLWAKAAESVGAPYRSLLFAQPQSAVSPVVPVRPLGQAAATIWVFGWLAALPVAVAFLGASWRRPSTAPGQPVMARLDELTLKAVVPMLVMAYVGAYIFSPLRAEAILGEWAEIFPPTAPGVNAPRYLVPIYLAWTLLLSFALGCLSQAGGWRRWTGWLALVLVAGSGGLQAQGDWFDDRDPWATVGNVEPYYYFKMFGPGRGPPREVHEKCATDNPVSRSNHLFTLGWFIGQTPEQLLSAPRADREALDSFLKGRSLSEEDIRVVVHGMGRALGDQMFSSFQLESDEVLGVARKSAEALGKGRGGPYLYGVGESMDHGRLSSKPSQLVSLLCFEMRWGTRPLCSLAGQLLADTGLTEVPQDPQGLFVADVPALADLPPSVRLELVRGASIGLVNSSAITDLDDARVASWPDELGVFFAESWQAWKTGENWHDPGAAGFVPGPFR